MSPVPQVSLEPQEDQESLADQVHQGCRERKVRPVGMGSLDRLESKESQENLVLVVQVHLDFQGCQALRETQVFQAHPAALVSLVRRERVVSPASLVPQATLALPALQDWVCKVPKDSKDAQDHQEEQVHLAQRVLAGLKDQGASKERREYLEPPVSRASQARKETQAFQDSQAPRVVLGPLAPRETSVCLVFLDSLGRRETLDFQVVSVFPVTQEMWDLLVPLVTPVYPRHPSWSKESEDPLVVQASPVLGDNLAPLDVPDSQVSRVLPEIPVWRVPLASVVHQAEKETKDPPVSSVSVAILVLLVPTVHRVLRVFRAPPPRTAS